jgi:hypothetical protein
MAPSRIRAATSVEGRKASASMAWPAP